MTKYRAKRTEIDGVSFASKKEAKRYVELRALQSAGEIERLELQPKFDISIGGRHICNYIADFKYTKLTPNGSAIVVEDVKGYKTSVYRLKKKLVEACYVGLVITEI